MILRTAFVIALLMALGGILSACGFSNTFNYGHGQGRARTAADFREGVDFVAENPAPPIWGARNTVVIT
jgi:hypothetical protein